MTQEKFEPKFDANGLISVITVDDNTGQILMQAYMTREALELTFKTQQAVYWSRSRNEIWHKGKTSGHVQHVKSISVDCDQDCLILRVDPVGGIACHTGSPSCFFKDLKNWAGTDKIDSVFLESNQIKK